MCFKVTGINTFSVEQREGRVLLTVVCMVTGYVLCWMPYGVVAMLSSFGRPDMVSPAARLIPSLLAKTSTVLNPFIYVLLNNQVTLLARIMKVCFYPLRGTWFLSLDFTPIQQKFLLCITCYTHLPSFFSSVCAFLSSPGICCIWSGADLKPRPLRSTIQSTAAFWSLLTLPNCLQRN